MLFPLPPFSAALFSLLPGSYQQIEVLLARVTAVAEGLRSSIGARFCSTVPVLSLEADLLTVLDLSGRFTWVKSRLGVAGV